MRCLFDEKTVYLEVEIEGINHISSWRKTLVNITRESEKKYELLVFLA